MSKKEEDDQFDKPGLMMGKLSGLINEKNTVDYIKRKFRLFLLKFKNDKNEFVYQKKIDEMCAKNNQSIIVDFNDLSNSFRTLSYWLFETPSLIFPYMNMVAYEIATAYYPNFSNIQTEIYVKIDNFMLQEDIRDLRTHHINTLISVQGVITRRYPVYQKLKKMFYYCVKCGHRKGPVYQNDNSIVSLGQCPSCMESGKYMIENETKIYGNHQKITIQECPSKVPPGRVPRYKQVILLGDNVDKVKPGDEVNIVGIYRSKFDLAMNAKHGLPIFRTFIESNHLKKTNVILSDSLTSSDINDIKKYSKHPNILDIITNSIAPSLYGFEQVKKSIAMTLFGGVPRVGENHSIRGDINILLVGDPGLGKSQLLKYV